MNPVSNQITTYDPAVAPAQPTPLPSIHALLHTSYDDTLFGRLGAIWRVATQPYCLVSYVGWTLSAIGMTVSPLRTKQAQALTIAPAALSVATTLACVNGHELKEIMRRSFILFKEAVSVDIQDIVTAVDYNKKVLAFEHARRTMIARFAHDSEMLSHFQKHYDKINDALVTKWMDYNEIRWRALHPASKDSLPAVFGEAERIFLESIDDDASLLLEADMPEEVSQAIEAIRFAATNVELSMEQLSESFIKVIEMRQQFEILTDAMRTDQSLSSATRKSLENYITLFQFIGNPPAAITKIVDDYIEHLSDTVESIKIVSQPTGGSRAVRVIPNFAEWNFRGHLEEHYNMEYGVKEAPKVPSLPSVGPS